MRIISDTNIFLAVALDEPEKPRILQLTAGVTLIAPQILPYEIGNALSAMCKRHQLVREEATEVQQIVTQIPVRLVSVNIYNALELALNFGIYAYDAYFLECARSQALPLITLDQKMKRVAGKLGIRIME